MFLYSVVFHIAQCVQRDYAAYMFASTGLTFIKLCIRVHRFTSIFFSVLICNTGLKELNEGNLALTAFPILSLSVIILSESVNLW